MKGVISMSHFVISGFSDEIDSNIRVQFDEIKKMGIDFFEARGINDKNIADLDDEEISELLSLMNEFGVKASSIGSPIGKISITDDFLPHFEKFKRVVEIAKKLGAKYIRIFSFFVMDGQYEKHREEVISRLSKLIEYAKKEDVVLLHENEKDIYGDTVERCVDLLSELYCDNFKAVFDPANFVQCGQDTESGFLKLEPYIEYMHIKDATPDGRVVPPGEGNGNIEFILKSLKEKGYRGFLSLEPHLGSFAGLDKLENSDEMLKLEKSSAEKYKVAYDALNKIIERI